MYSGASGLIYIAVQSTVHSTLAHIEHSSHKHHKKFEIIKKHYSSSHRMKRREEKKVQDDYEFKVRVFLFLAVKPSFHASRVIADVSYLGGDLFFSVQYMHEQFEVISRVVD
jgi:hypothetical protein